MQALRFSVDGNISNFRRSVNGKPLMCFQIERTVFKCLVVF